MTLPHPHTGIHLTIPVPNGVFAQEDQTKWMNQRFTVGNASCRLIGLKLYRFFRGLPDGQIIFKKEDLVDEVFTKKEQLMSANVTQVGRHIVNSVIYKPVLQRRTKDPSTRGMTWRFNSPRDVEYGVAHQIGVWLPDHMLAAGIIEDVSELTESTLAEELQMIYDDTWDNLIELFLDPEVVQEYQRATTTMEIPEGANWQVAKQED